MLSKDDDFARRRYHKGRGHWTGLFSVGLYAMHQRPIAIHMGLAIAWAVGAIAMHAFVHLGISNDALSVGSLGGQRRRGTWLALWLSFRISVLKDFPPPLSFVVSKLSPSSLSVFICSLGPGCAAEIEGVIRGANSSAGQVVADEGAHGL